MNCPSCGAPMRLKPGEDCYTCDYCHSVYVPDKNADGVRILGPSDPSAALTCPNCNADLVEAAIEKTRIHYCQKCRGMLIPMSVFRELISSLQVSQGASLNQPPANPADLKRVLACPSCHQHMDTHVYEGGGNAVIESCYKCLLNWLDYGVLAHIVHAPDDTNPATISDLGSTGTYDGPI